MKVVLLALILLVSGCVSIRHTATGIEIKSLGITKYNNNFILGYINIKEYVYEEEVNRVDCCRSCH